jgi:hypothetical protein
MAKSRPTVYEALRDAGFRSIRVDTAPLVDPKNPLCTVTADDFQGKGHVLAAAAEAVTLSGQTPRNMRAFGSTMGAVIIIEGIPQASAGMPEASVNQQPVTP